MYFGTKIAQSWSSVAKFLRHEKSRVKCQKKEGANPGQLFLAFGPHQQGAAQSLPGTAGLK